MFAFGETVTRQRAALVTDPYSGETSALDWSAPDELEIPSVAFDPGGSFETTEPGRNPVDTSPKLYDPSYADIAASDRIVCRGKTYDVDGDPLVYRHPMTGWSPGQVVNLKIREG